MPRCALIVVLVSCFAGDVRSLAQSPEEAAKPKNPAVADENLPELPETRVIGSPPADDSSNANPVWNLPDGGGSVLEGTVFASPKATGYSAPSSTTGTLIDVPNIDVPGSIDVVTEDLWVDQQALQMNDILRDIGGAVKSGNQLRVDAFYLRGFEVRARDYRKNGFLDPTYTPRDFANVERIEVLKGPASVLYGAGQPSGVVNLITKKPLERRIHNADVQFGSFGLERYTIDATGPLNEGKSLLYRINAAYENGDSFRDYGFVERTFVAPALTWVLAADTTLTWEGEYVNDRRRFDTGLAAINGDAGALPSNRFLGEPSNDQQHYFDYRQTLMLTRQINDDWAWNFGGYSLFFGGPSSATYPVSYINGMIPSLGQNGFFRVRQNIDPWQEQYHSAIANISGKFHGNLVTHNVVLGTEQGWSISEPFHGEYSVPTLSPTTWLAIDGMSPVYNNPYFGMPNPATPIHYDATYRANRHGVYLEDLIDVGEHWKVLAGVRYDHMDTVFIREMTGAFPRIRTEQGFDHGSPRVGVVYQPIPEELSYYATYSDSFDPPGGGVRATTDPLLPELGQTWEGGIKMKLSDNLTLNAAGFYITKQNVTTDRYVTTGGSTVIETSQIGRQRSQGVELDVLGQITDRWSIVGNWCYVDTLLTDPDDPSLDGGPARGVPHNTLNVWTRYNLMQCKHQTMGLALGMIHVGERLGDYIAPPNPRFFLPSYTRWDAGVYYRRGRLDTSLYFENIFDTEYFTSSLSQYQVTPGNPFTVRAQVGLRF